MSDELTTAPARARRLASPLVQAVVIVVGFALAGLVCGLLWEAAWHPETGEVVKHVWYPFSWDRAMPTEFAGTGWYVVISLVVGALLGALASLLLDRSELVTLAAVVVGGLLAAYLMRVVGLHRGPGDPQRIAKTAADGTKLPTELRLASWWLVLVFPGAALTALSVVFLTVTKRGAKRSFEPAVEVAEAG